MMKRLFYPLLILIAASSYGVVSTILKFGINAGFTSSEVVTSQYAIGLALAIALFIFTKQNVPKLSISMLIKLAIIGIFTAMTGIFYGYSLDYLPASLAVVLLFQFTWISVLINCIVHKKWPTRVEFISLITLFVGTILAAGIIDASLTHLPLVGWLWGLASAVSFAIFIQLNSTSMPNLSTTTRTTIVSFFAFVVVCLFLSPEIMWNGQLLSNLSMYGLLLGILGIVLPIYLFSLAAPKVGGNLVSILSAMELPVAIVVAVLFLNEAMTTLQLVGIVIILVGIVLPYIKIPNIK